MTVKTKLNRVLTKKPAEILDDVGVGSFGDNPLGASGTSSGSSEPVRGQVLDADSDAFILSDNHNSKWHHNVQRKNISNFLAFRTIPK